MNDGRTNLENFEEEHSRYKRVASAKALRGQQSIMGFRNS
jgi:hypothetical protein